ncbi:hypothetical protein BC829DRAFT_403642 [Chytridium lagenaria]|nr:hypothetical protein BC829DRAFT_403642 [Chytridium lagenaria]
MADHLASIYGTEKDKVNCSFYFKIGSIADTATDAPVSTSSLPFLKPSSSQTSTSTLPMTPHVSWTELQLQEHFDLFFEDMFVELAKFGEVEELNVCDNVGDHLVGNVYVRYKYEEDSAKAVENLNQRFYAGRPLYAELSPVTDFGEACCRQYDNGECTRGGFCNFMHLKVVSRAMKKDLFEAQRLSLKELKKKDRSEDRDEDRSRGDREDRHRDRDRRDRSDRDRDRDRDRERDRDRDRDRDERPRDRDRKDRDRGSSRRTRDEEDENGSGHLNGNGNGAAPYNNLYE